MDKINKNYLWFIVIVVVIGLGIWLFGGKHGAPENAPTTPPTQQAANVPATTTPESSMQEDTWTGLLKTSDNPAKGNLMLVTAQQTIYIRTERDFSSLVGKNVTVTYSGDQQSFVLGDIVSAEPQ